LGQRKGKSQILLPFFIKGESLGGVRSDIDDALPNEESKKWYLSGASRGKGRVEHRGITASKGKHKRKTPLHRIQLKPAYEPVKEKKGRGMQKTIRGWRKKNAGHSRGTVCFILITGPYHGAGLTAQLVGLEHSPRGKKLGVGGEYKEAKYNRVTVTRRMQRCRQSGGTEAISREKKGELKSDWNGRVTWGV